MILSNFNSIDLTIDKILSEISWNQKTKRYYFDDGNKKTVITQKALDKLTELHIQDSTNQLEKLGKGLINNELTLLQWQLQSKEVLRELHLANMLLARGGKNNVTNVDYLAVGRTLKSEYKYFQQFARDVNRGYSVNDNGQKIMLTQARFLDRLSKYALSSRVSYEKGIETNMSETGYTHSQRFLNSSIPCITCPRYSALGMQPIGVLPLPKTQCQCGSRCKCEIRYYKLKAGKK